MKSLFVVILALFTIQLNLWAEPIRVLTEDLAPLNYLENGELKGSAVTKVRKVLEELDYSDQSIEVLPWTRAYDIALHESNILLFSTARFPQREELFHWIGVIEDFDMWAYCKKGAAHNNHDKNSVKHMSVGLKDYIRPFFRLEDHGYSNIKTVKSYQHGLRMLAADRMDFIVAPKKVMERERATFGSAGADIIPCYHLSEISTTLYLAMSKKSSPELVNKFRESWQKHYPND